MRLFETLLRIMTLVLTLSISSVFANEHVFPPWMSIGYEVEFKESVGRDFKPSRYKNLLRKMTVEDRHTDNLEWRSRPIYGDSYEIFSEMNEILRAPTREHLSSFHVHIRFPKSVIQNGLGESKFQDWVRAVGEFVYIQRLEKSAYTARRMTSATVGRPLGDLGERSTIRLQTFGDHFDLEFRGAVLDIDFLENLVWTTVETISSPEEFLRSYGSKVSEVQKLMNQDSQRPLLNAFIHDVLVASGQPGLTPHEASRLFSKISILGPNIPMLDPFESLSFLSLEEKEKIESLRKKWVLRFMKGLREHPGWPNEVPSDILQRFENVVQKFIYDSDLSGIYEKMFHFERHAPVGCMYRLKNSKAPD